MGKNILGYSLISDSISILSLLGEFHTPLMASGCPSAKGLILCNDSPTSGDCWISTLYKLPDTTKISSIRRQSFSVPNFHLGLYFLQKYDTTENIGIFLRQDSFQPLVVCNNFVPDELVDLADTISLPLNSLANTSPCFTELADCKQFFRELPDNLTFALTQAFTSKSYLQLQNTESSSLLINQLAIIAEIYLFWFRSQHNEEETGIRRNSLQRNMQELFQNHLNCDTTVDLANTFVHIFYKYLDSHTDISYCACDQIEGEANTRLNTGQTILWSAEYYFISSSLLKAICQPLLENIGWHKILRNLAREGVISADANQQSNYTCKKTLYNAFGQTSISRFIRLNKKALCSNEHLTLEERRQIHDTVSR